jgi:AcrR family transcriptional regulator
MTSEERILRAARRIYEKDGMPGLSMRRVSAQVGLTPMALYRHYADKSALIEALVADGFAQFETFVAGAADAPTPGARFRAVLDAYVDFALKRPRTFELMFFIPRDGVPPAPASLEASSSPSFTRIIAAVKEAMQDGTLAPDDVGQVLLLAWSTIHGLIALHFSGRFGHDDRAFRPIASQVIDRLMRALAPRATTPNP